MCSSCNRHKKDQKSNQQTNVKDQKTINLIFTDSTAWFLLHVKYNPSVCVWMCVCVCVCVYVCVNSKLPILTFFSIIHTWPLDFTKWPFKFQHRGPKWPSIFMAVRSTDEGLKDYSGGVAQLVKRQTGMLRTDSVPWCNKGFYSQCQLSVQTLHYLCVHIKDPVVHVRH